MSERSVVALLCLLVVTLLLFEAQSLSISAHEVQGITNATSYYYMAIGQLWQTFHHELLLRSSSVILHLFNALLFYRLSHHFLNRSSDRLYLLAIFLLLPGINSSAVLLDPAVFHLFLLLLYYNVLQRFELSRLILLVALLLISQVFLILLFAEIFYAIAKRDKSLLFGSITLFTMGMYWYGVDPGGIPKGHFLDLFGGYVAIFSPFIWLYLLYAIYRKQITHAKNEVHVVAMTALLLSFFLSIRQAIHVEIFAPFVVPALLIAAQIFSYSYHVRLPQFRVVYRVGLSVAMLFLMVNAVIVFFNPLLYLVLEEPKHHFAYRNHVAKELAQTLQTHGIFCIDARDSQLQSRLAFYGVAFCKKHQLAAEKKVNSDINVTICYNKKPIFPAYVTN